MEQSNVEIVLRFNKVKEWKVRGLNENYLLTTSWRCGTCFFL